jgi:hypothetical protein
MIGEITIRDLPEEIPSFLRNEDTALEIGQLSREPDRSRGSGNPHDSDLDPGHFIDIGDDLTIAGAVPLNNLPATRGEFDTALRRAGSDQYKVGYLPYNIIDGFQQLVKDFAIWRADAAGVRLAKNDEDRAWFARDQALREMLTIRDLGYWSHFVEDATMPMHVSIHYDGWGNFSNPENYPAAKGLHAQFEDAFVHANVGESDIQAVVPAPAAVSGDIKAWTENYLAQSAAKLVPLYELAARQPFDKPDAQEKAFAVERLAAATAALRDLIVAAWEESATAQLGYPAVAVSDFESGKTYPMAVLKGE